MGLQMSTLSTTRVTREASSSRAFAGSQLFPKDKLNNKLTSTTLSVIVPVYNEQYLIEASLERLKVLSESPLLDFVMATPSTTGNLPGPRGLAPPNRYR